jgi:hypothetical protein
VAGTHFSRATPAKRRESAGRQPQAPALHPGAALPRHGGIQLSRLAGGAFGASAAFTLSLALYLCTLAPGMLRGDSGEFQWASSALEVPHATRYPLFTVAGCAWQLALPLGCGR